MSKETNTDEDEEDEEILKLAFPISFERDHTQGPTNALVTLIEYVKMSLYSFSIKEHEPRMKIMLDM